MQQNIMLFIVVFAILGTIATLVSRATTASVAIEAESGNVASPASINPDSNASGGRSLLFGPPKIVGSGDPTPANKSRLGVDINDLPPGITLATAYDTIASLGFGWVRTGPGISDYTNMNPGNFDYELSQAKRTNTKVMAVLSYAYGPTGSAGCNNGHCAPKDPAAWAHYAGQLVARWKAQYPGQVGAVEVWNEANNGQFWNPVDPVKYTDLLKRTYLEIKAVDPNMIVVASGPAPGGGNKSADSGNLTDDPRNPATWYKQLYAAGAKGFFDAAGNHPYDTKNLATNVTASGLRNTFWIRKVMDANGEQSKQIWSTEAGLVSCLSGPGGNPPMTEKQRGERIASDLKDFWYGVHDPADGHTTGYTTTNDWNAGPYFVFKLYKSTTSDPGLGLVYNTNAIMQFTSATDAANEPKCTSSPDFYQPDITATLKYISAAKQ